VQIDTQNAKIISLTDLTRLDEMGDEEIDFADLPEVPADLFAKAIVKRGLKPRTKEQLTIRIDSDVLAWFKQQGRGYQTKINTLLRAYMEAHQSKPPRLREKA
jgi:uncharacterized protein (DUF4415 family)